MKEKRYCKVCGKELSRKNKTGYCSIHLPRTGENNPFYGKTHSKKTKEILKNKCAEATKKLWEDETYRNKVITNATGIKRSDEFKKNQSINALKQFKNESQRKIRVEKMKENWEKGLITKNHHDSINVSKQEKEFINMLTENGFDISHKNFTYVDKITNRKRFLIPDGIYEEGKIILEYNGSFWHADPTRGYNENDIIHHDITAKEIWKRDEEKYNIYKSNGYNVFVAWSDQYLNNKEKCLEEFKKFLKDVKINKKNLEN